MSAATKESTATMPRTSRRLDPEARGATNKQLPSLPESTSQELSPSALQASSHDLVTKYNIKRITSWFKCWRTWQRRVFTCRVMEHCSKQHLEFLATALEPVLHFDFASSFSAPLQSLHLDSVATFQVQRAVLQSVVSPRVLEASNSLSQFTSTISTTDSNVSTKRSSMGLKQASSNRLTQSKGKLSDKSGSSLKIPSTNDMKIILTTASSCSSNKARGQILPSLPLVHVQHARSLSHDRPSAASMEDLVTLQRQHFSSVPDFKSTTDLLRNMRQSDVLRTKAKRQRRHKKSNTVGTYHVMTRSSGEERRQAELFKEQLSVASNVNNYCILLLKCPWAKYSLLFSPALPAHNIPRTEIIFLQNLLRAYIGSIPVYRLQ